MSSLPETQVLDQAISWHLRLRDADDTAWVEFTQWLEADPAHNDAYEAVADEDEWVAPLLAAASFPAASAQTAPQTANDDPAEANVRPAVTRRAAWRWGALAASAVVAGFLAIQLVPGSNGDTLETAPGETRTIALADGGEIKLNGGTKLALDPRDERKATLISGEARFKIAHDEAHPFTLIAGDSRVVDVGTVFNVVRTDNQLRVAVAEGAVRFEGISRKANLKPGDALSADPRGAVRIAHKPVAAIGSWADGALVYDRAPLGMVSEDLSRSLGVTLTLPPAMQSKPFSGVIQTNGSHEAVRARLEELLGATIIADGSNWTM